MKYNLSNLKKNEYLLRKFVKLIGKCLIEILKISNI